MARPALSASRALSVLNFLAAHSGEQFTLTDLATNLDINRASAHALLEVLRDEGYIVRHSRLRTYSLGPSVVALGSAALDCHPSIDQARDEARRLSDDLSLSVAVTAVAGEDIVVLARAGRHMPHDMATHVGQRVRIVPPLGAIFVAWHDPTVWLERAPEPEAMRDLLGEIRSRGWAAALRSPGDYQVLGQLDEASSYEVLMVTAPVFGTGGDAVVALTLLGLPGELSAEQLRSYGEQLRDAGLVATRRSGGRPPALQEPSAMGRAPSKL